MPGAFCCPLRLAGGRMIVVIRQNPYTHHIPRPGGVNRLAFLLRLVGSLPRKGAGSGKMIVLG